MYRKIVWCYIIVLTLLDISLNTKLSAQGKSHGNGVSVHESLMEGISLQEWGKDGGGEGEGVGRGRAVPPGTLALAPASLSFGAAALAAPHAAHVTITNTANETIHLASVAGTTPDFHASFFESKTLAPQANTTFTVVYLGRREGAVAAYLYIHTSKGVYKYPVSAVGVASEYRVWPLVGLRVPLNATLQPRLTLYNPTDTTIQVSEVYSSGSWVGLSLPGGGATLDKAAWAVPPGATRDLLALHVEAGSGSAPRTAYLRIKGSWPGAPLVVCVEATPAPAGVYLAPPQLRLAVRGARDPPERFLLHAGSSAGASLDLAAAAGVEGATCSGTHDPPPPPPAAHNGRTSPPGATLALLHGTVPAHSAPAPLAHLTLDYGKMWAGAGAGAGAEARHCAGWARVGAAHVPYSVTLMPGTVSLHPKHLHFVTANPKDAMKVQEITALNEFPIPVRIAELHFPDEVEEYFHTESFGPVCVEAGQLARLGTVRLRASHADRELHAHITVNTNITDYHLPLLLYSGNFHIEWDWPSEWWCSDQLDLGVVSTGGTVEVVGRVGRGAAHALAGIQRVDAHLEGGEAHITLLDDDEDGVVGVRVRVRAPRGAGPAHGWLELRAEHAGTRVALVLHAHAGDVRVLDVQLPPIAPYVWSSTPLVVESSMSLRMRVLNVTHHTDPALTVHLDVDRSLRPGRSVVGSVMYAPEVHCEPRCYTGLDVKTGEGAAWVARGATPLTSAALEEDGAEARGRRALYRATSPHLAPLVVETGRVRRLHAAVRASPTWPRLAPASPLAFPLAAVGAGGSLSLPLTIHNPSSTHTLLLQPHVHHQRIDIDEDEEEMEMEDECPECRRCGSSFGVGEWRATRGSVGEWGGGGGGRGGYLLLQPRAELELTITFTPSTADDLAAYIYLRNNLTILERVSVRGRGAHPTFEVEGREPNSTAPIVVEVTECGAEGGAGGARRALLVRNTGAVPLRLKGWRLAGHACAARGFRLRPCAAIALAPNESRAVHLAFAADWTRARAHAALAVRAGDTTHTFQVAGAVPARTLARCAGGARRPPFEPALRALGAALALLAFAGAAALAAADAERALRRHRAQRPPPPPVRDPLDLRALARPAPPPPAPPAAPRRRRTPRRRAAPSLDPAGERLAFERWRAEVERRALEVAGGTGPDPPPDLEDDDSRSTSEEGEVEDAPPPHTPPPPPREDTSSSSPDSSPPPPRDSCSYSSGLRGEPEEEGVSTGSDSSSAGDDRSEGSEGGAGASAPVASAPAPRPAASHPACLDASCRRRDAPRPPTAARGARALARRDRAPRRRDRAPEPPRPTRPEPPRVPPVRWGTSWSSVVSSRAPPPHTESAPPPRPAPPVPSPPPAIDNLTGVGGGAPLAPIGSDVRRRLGSHSLFFYSSGEGVAVPGTSAPTARWPPGEDAPEPAYRPLDTLWGADAWSWGGTAARAAPAPAPTPLRPPPGFPLPRAVRPYDPFHSLASIWTPAALDWRLESTPPPDDKYDAPPPPSSNTNNTSN